MSASTIYAKREKYTTNFDLKIKNVLCLFSMSHCIISHFANGFICLSLWSCVLPTNWVSFTHYSFFRFGNSKAKNKKKPSTLCVSLNSLAAPLHHCYYFEVVVYTHFFFVFLSYFVVVVVVATYSIATHIYKRICASDILNAITIYAFWVCFFFVFTMTRRYYLMQQAW